MKNKIFAITLSAILLSGAILLTITDSKEKSTNGKKKKMFPHEWMDYQRTYPYDYIKQESYLEAMYQASDLHKATAHRNYNWEFAGPENIGGRITDLVIDPEDSDVVYLGGASGGILKSTNAGATWENIFEQAPVISIGDLAIDPNNTDILFAGTGEANASSYSFRGNGIYKSTDAGQSWTNIGLESSAYIGRIIVDYNNSQNVYVAACGDLFSQGGERGIYKSADGGNVWENILFVNDSTSGIDLVQHPTDPDILLAGMWERRRGLTFRNSFGDGSGIWKTTDGGDSWTELTNGLPTGDNVGRIGIDISRSNPDVMYAFYDMPNSEVRVYKTTDGGGTWTRTNDFVLSGMNSSFGWYFGQIRVDPVNPERVYVLGVELYRTDNGGENWIQLAGYGVGNIHVDHHAMHIDETTGRIYEGNDGGYYISDDLGESWTKINNVPLTQFYDIEIDYNNPERIYGGTQDNNTIRTMTGALDDWEAILGGDGMYCLVDYVDNDNIYAEYQYGGLCKSENGGWSFQYIANQMSNDRVNWSAPFVMDPQDPEILYFGTYRVWKTTNGGDYWTSVSGDLTQGGTNYYHTITTLDVSDINRNIVFAGTADGRVHVSTDAGTSWDDISEGLPERWITRVAADPFDENTLYATVSGFRWDEEEPHVFKSENLGEDWMDITANLPELPVNVIVPDPSVPGRLFIGTDAGVFFKEAWSDEWQSLMQGLPNVAVTAMKLHNPTRTLVIGTYGISAYRLDLDFLVGSEEVSAGGEHSDILNAYPNPFNPETGNLTIEAFNIGGKEISIEICDLSGRKVKTLFQGNTSNSTRLSWDGTNENGSMLKPGTYICTLKGSGYTDMLKINLIH